MNIRECQPWRLVWSCKKHHDDLFPITISHCSSASCCPVNLLQLASLESNPFIDNVDCFSIGTCLVRFISSRILFVIAKRTNQLADSYLHSQTNHLCVTSQLLAINLELIQQTQVVPINELGNNINFVIICTFLRQTKSKQLH